MLAKVADTRTLGVKIIFSIFAIVILARLLFLQLFEEKYKVMSNDITIYRKVMYPPRGVIFDRNGLPLVINVPAFDLMVTPSEIKKSLDTNQICNILSITKEDFEKRIANTTFKNGYRRQGVFLEQLSEEQTAKFQENMYQFNGFEMLERPLRSYPHPYGAAFLGYIGEVSPSMLSKERFSSYSQGEYVGISGLELAYEEVLRGQRGVYYYERDNFNRPRDRYKGGELDTAAVAGRSLELTLDIELQKLGEELMKNKLGSVVAIDPATGGILAMVSSPGYDPNLLRGKERSKNFYKLSQDATKPLLNRAITASYNPGSTQKPMTALAALDAGVITPNYGYPCGGGYYACGRRIGCTHSGGGHAANLRAAIANSCNAYFCHIYRLVLDAPKYGGVRNGLEKWHEYMSSFGFGHPTGVDLPFENSGTLFTKEDYDKRYKGPNWNSCTHAIVGMGQGEILQTPIQMANAMAIIANKGFYYTPHFVKSIDGNENDTLLKKFKVKHEVTHISDTAYAIVGLGMMDVVTHGTGKVARMPNIEVAAKTGTVENKAAIGGKAVKLQNHSMFVAFAPRVNPKIAIAVAVENAGYGATWAGPVASLMIEKYLTDTVAPNRKSLADKMYNANLITKYVYILDSLQRQKDLRIWENKQAKKREEDSIKRHHDSIWVKYYLDKRMKTLANQK